MKKQDKERLQKQYEAWKKDSEATLQWMEDGQKTIRNFTIGICSFTFILGITFLIIAINLK